MAVFSFFLGGMAGNEPLARCDICNSFLRDSGKFHFFQRDGEILSLQWDAGYPYFEAESPLYQPGLETCLRNIY